MNFIIVLQSPSPFVMVSFFCADTKFSFNKRRLTSRWLRKVCVYENRRLASINIIFCSDNYILNLNKKYLSHSYFTDIITFDYCQCEEISGDLFISIDSVRDNAVFYNTTFDNELNRVIVHGVLHLIGYDDSSDDEIRVMRQKEDYYLSVLDEFFNNN